MKPDSNKELKSRFHRLSGGDFFLDSDTDTLGRYLLRKGWVDTDQIESLEKPGDGNMNLVLRAQFGSSNSLIVKQARPWVEKYPSLDAPVNRINVEHRYYKFINQFHLLKQYSPSIIGFDPTNHLMAMEDLGSAKDYSYVYKSGNSFQTGEIKNAITYLNQLHQLPVPENFPSNLELRKLNHQHIFQLPFVSGAIDLKKIQPNLTAIAGEIQRDRTLVNRIRELGEVYLGDGDSLLHGDFYPGSLLKASSGLKVIDPEFAFKGPREWDLAVLTAHLALANASSDQLLLALSAFHKAADFDENLFAGFAGTEILRRLLGLAQLPVEMSFMGKTQLIRRAVSCVKSGKIDTLSGYEENLSNYVSGNLLL